MTDKKLGKRRASPPPDSLVPRHDQPGFLVPLSTKSERTPHLTLHRSESPQGEPFPGIGLSPPKEGTSSQHPVFQLSPPVQDREGPRLASPHGREVTRKQTAGSSNLLAPEFDRRSSFDNLQFAEKYRVREEVLERDGIPQNYYAVPAVEMLWEGIQPANVRSDAVYRLSPDSFGELIHTGRLTMRLIPHHEYDFIVLEDEPDVIRFFDSTEWNQGDQVKAGHTSLLTSHEKRLVGSRERPALIKYAGRFVTDGTGKVIKWSNQSGHFRPFWQYAQPFANHWRLDRIEFSRNVLNAAKQEPYNIFNEWDGYNDDLVSSSNHIYHNGYADEVSNNLDHGGKSGYIYKDLNGYNDNNMGLLFVITVICLEVMFMCCLLAVGICLFGFICNALLKKTKQKIEQEEFSVMDDEHV